MIEMTFVDDEDDSPNFNNANLCNVDGAYQSCLRWVQNDNKQISLDHSLIYQAFFDLITSDDDEKADGIDYLLEGGLPKRLHTDREPLVMVVSKRLQDPRLLDMLMVFKYHDFDFDEGYGSEGNATTILQESCPSLLVALNNIDMYEWFLEK